MARRRWQTWQVHSNLGNVKISRPANVITIWPPFPDALKTQELRLTTERANRVCNGQMLADTIAKTNEVQECSILEKPPLGSMRLPNLVNTNVT